MAEMSGGTLNASLLDPTIALKAGAAPVFDPLATMGKVQALQSSILNNRLVGQQLQSKIMGGRALIGAIDPATGLPDQAKVGQFFVDHPDQAQFGAQAISDAQTLNTAQLANIGQNAENQRKQIGLSLDQGKILNASMLPVIHKFSTPGPDGKVPVPTSDDLQKAYADAITNMGPGLTQTALGRAMESIRDAGKDPAKILQAMKGAALTGNPTPETIGMVFGTPTALATGGGTTIMRNPGLGGPTEIGATIPNTPTAETKAALVDWTDPDTGKVYKIPRGALGDMAGAGAPGGARNGRYPGGASLGAGAPRGAVAPGAMAPGTPEMMAKSAETYLADSSAVPNVRRTITGFDQLYKALQIAKTGPGSETLQNLRGVADTYGIPLPGITNKNETEAYAEVKKWSATVLGTEAARLGLGTDQARAIQGEATPGDHTVKGAALAMIPILRGLKAMDLVAPIIAKQKGWTPQQYVEQRAQWANTVDPLAFGADMMPTDQRKALIARMKPDQKTRYANGLRSAIAAGLFTADDLR